jgi:hypothetical protein
MKGYGKEKIKLHEAADTHLFPAVLYFQKRTQARPDLWSKKEIDEKHWFHRSWHPEVRTHRER